MMLSPEQRVSFINNDKKYYLLRLLATSIAFYEDNATLLLVPTNAFSDSAFIKEIMANHATI
ncbi:MAG: hypothetical protein CVU27_04675 [Betaproteobacteria bacterium HGW-Betaproteobacteria-20]|jgi:hypothetical protein|nr:MAG: hypothetical protein CVU27_04675 [Betaproteobacteria bacterium HGW-Betaproteobacteria-20]